MIFSIFTFILPLIMGFLLSSHCMGAAYLQTNSPYEGVRYVQNSVLRDMPIPLIFYFLVPIEIFSLITLSLMSKHAILLRFDFDKFYSEYYTEKKSLKEKYDV